MQRTIKGAALAAALLLVATVEARAADPFDWTGVYVGVNAGAAYARERWNFSQIGTDANSNVWSGVAGGTLG
jgi:opacity protein-like surface antigen